MSASLQENDSGDQRVAPAVEGAGQDDPAFPAKAEFQHCGNEATEPDASWSRTLGRPILLAFVASCLSSTGSCSLQFCQYLPPPSRLDRLAPDCSLSLRAKGTSMQLQGNAV
jgi:hypothetical protein